MATVRVYRAYLHDPDLQDARARWPFVNMWDNHEFSWLGWQSLQKSREKRDLRNAEVAANEAFFEYQPARMARPSGNSLERFSPPKVVDAPITKFDDQGSGRKRTTSRRSAASRVIVQYVGVEM